MKKIFSYITNLFTKDFANNTPKVEDSKFPSKNFLSNESSLALKKIINYDFKNIGYFEQALTHRSYLQLTNKQTLSNERLEFLGDSILNMLVGESIFNNNPDWQEGQMTKLRSRLVSRKALTLLAHRIGLDKFVLLNVSAEQSLEQGNDSLLADAFEAIIAAIYLDSGSNLDEPREFLKRTILKEETILEVQSSDINFKSLLLEYVQGIGSVAPHYEVIQQEGPDHERVFTIVVHVNDSIHGTGKGRSKKDAEQLAAAEAIKSLGVPINTNA